MFGTTPAVITRAFELHGAGSIGAPVGYPPPVAYGSGMIGENGEALATAGAVSGVVLAVGILANLALLGGLTYIGYRAGKASCGK